MDAKMYYIEWHAATLQYILSNPLWKTRENAPLNAIVSATDRACNG